MKPFSELDRLKKENAALRGVLQDLALYLSVGVGDDKTTPEEYGKRIRWGIDHLITLDRNHRL